MQKSILVLTWQTTLRSSSKLKSEVKNMKLIVETVEPNEINVLNEATEDGKKHWYISGPFMQADTKNRNGRIYPKKILEREVEKYIKEKVNTKQAMGELDHPPQTTINLERVSHLVESLKFEGNDVIGKAKILDTPCGRTVQSLLDGGVKLGVSPVVLDR